MTYGVRILNSFGSTVISESYNNLHIIASGTVANGQSLPNPVTVVPAHYVSYYTYGGQTYPMVDDIVVTLVRPNHADPYGGHTLYLNSTYQGAWDFIGNHKLYSTTGSLEWAYAIRKPNRSSDVYGLVVYDSAGQISFDSGLRVVHWVHKMTATSCLEGSAVTSTTTAAIPPGAKRWVFRGVLDWFALKYRSDNYRYSVQLRFNSPTSFTASRRNTGRYLGLPPQSPAPWEFFFADTI